MNIDIREAFSLWDILNSYYVLSGKTLRYKAFVQAPDLNTILELLHKEAVGDINVLQQMMREYNIVSPNKNKVAVVGTKGVEFLDDEIIAVEILLFSQEHMELLLLALYGMAANDGLRKKLINMLHSKVAFVDNLMKYFSARGFVGVPPRLSASSAGLP